MRLLDGPIQSKATGSWEDQNTKEGEEEDGEAEKERRGGGEIMRKTERERVARKINREERNKCQETLRRRDRG